jgi:hypothetical protein
MLFVSSYCFLISPLVSTLPVAIHLSNHSSFYCFSFAILPNIKRDVSKSFGTGRLERELQMVQLSALQLYRYFVRQSSEFCRHNPLCCFSASVHRCKRKFRYDSVRKLLDTPSYTCLATRFRVFLRRVEVNYFTGTGSVSPWSNNSVNNWYT